MTDTIHPCTAFLIDPSARTVTQVAYSGDFQDIYREIQCDTFDVVYLGPKGDCIYVDDEGLLNGPTDFFWPKGGSSPLAGRGLVLGTDADGESVAPSITLEELRTMICFVEPVDINGEIVWLSA